MPPASQAGYQTPLPPAAPPRGRTTAAPDPHHSLLYFCHPVGWYCMRTLICILLRRALQSTFPELTACTFPSQHGYSHFCPASKSYLYFLDMRIVRIKYVHTHIYIYVCVLQFKVSPKVHVLKCNPYICTLTVWWQGSERLGLHQSWGWGFPDHIGDSLREERCAMLAHLLS